MSNAHESLSRLDNLLEAFVIAHETIYGLHRGLVDFERNSSVSAALLHESAHAVLKAVPEVTATATTLAARWHEQSVLDPAAAIGTAEQLEAELGLIAASLRELMDREREIIGELRSLAGDLD